MRQPAYARLVVKEITAVLNAYARESKARPNGVNAPLYVTRFADAIRRYSPPGSVYEKRLDHLLQTYGGASDDYRVFGLYMSILEALRDDYKAGVLRTIHERIH